jgi:Tfp pilus assembly protein PilO
MIKKLDKKICLIVAAVVLLVAGLIWLAFFWQFEKIKELSENIQKEQLDSLVKQERSQKVLELGKELSGIKTRGEELKAILVDKENAVPFLKLLEDIAVGTGNSVKISVADLTKISSQLSKKPAVQVSSDAESAKDIQKESQAQKAAKAKEKAPDFSNQLGFSVELSGGYGNFLDFLTRLENLPYFVQVYSFQVDPAVKGQAPQTASASADQANPGNVGNQGIKSTIIIGVYTNGK